LRIDSEIDRQAADEGALGVCGQAVVAFSLGIGEKWLKAEFPVETTSLEASSARSTAASTKRDAAALSRSGTAHTDIALRADWDSSADPGRFRRRFGSSPK
jgi:hypothetical protein